MNRIKLKCGGRPKRRKALFGEYAVAAATLASAAMQTAATAKASSQQSKAITDNARAQADAIKAQNENNTNLQRESMEFTKQQNAEIKQQQQDIQTTLQMLAGQQNMNDIMERNKAQVKYGGRPKRRKLKQQLPYGGGDMPFVVTDGGGVIPLNIDNNGYGLYELYGNDHEHYHKTRGGKNKTGVGIKFANGDIIEGEGNQNSNQGELMYITPDDAMFISKHNIDGFNPAKAVNQGMHPKEAFAIQEYNKAVLGYNDDGTKAKCGGRRKLKALMGIYNPIGTTTRNQFNAIDNSAIAGGAAYIKQNSSPVAKCGKRVSLRRKAASGTWWNNYGGATITSAANVLGAGINWIGNSISSNRLGKAYTQAGNILADAYGRLQTIDLSKLKEDDYDVNGTAIAAIQSPNIRYTAQRERVRRNAAAETREINRGTMSSAARQQRLAGTNDRYSQRINEIAEAENNANQQIIQGNMERITNTSATNAQLKAQAKQNYTNAMLQGMMYNNDIENTKISGAAQALADANTQLAGIRANSLQSSMNSLAGAIGASGQAFGSAFDTNRTYNNNVDLALIGADSVDKVDFLVMNADDPNNYARAKKLYDYYINTGNENHRKYAEQLAAAYKFGQNNTTTQNNRQTLTNTTYYPTYNQNNYRSTWMKPI